MAESGSDGFLSVMGFPFSTSRVLFAVFQPVPDLSAVFSLGLSLGARFSCSGALCVGARRDCSAVFLALELGSRVRRRASESSVLPWVIVLGVRGLNGSAMRRADRRIEALTCHCRFFAR